MTAALTEWAGSLHQTFRLLPEPSERFVAFLESEGRTEAQVLAALPYDAARARGGTGSPNPKRYRDLRQVVQTAGLAYEDAASRVRVTELGRTTLRYLRVLNEANAPVLGAHAAYALAGCQLRNPTGAGSRYDSSTEVFPFSFIWQAMLALDHQVTSEELNCEIFRTRDDDDLEEAIDNIAEARKRQNTGLLRAPVITGSSVNDRIIPWIALAGFGWTLIFDKGNDPQRLYYRIRPNAVSVLERAASLRPPHQDFASTAEYVEYISGLAGLPPVLAAPPAQTAAAAEGAS